MQDYSRIKIIRFNQTIKCSHIRFLQLPKTLQRSICSCRADAIFINPELNYSFPVKSRVAS